MPDYPLEGGCDCRRVRYRLLTAPIIVHCCHCRWCQRETGSAFAINAMIESERVELLSGEPIMVDTPSESGKGQKIARCPDCRVALWSYYPGGGPFLRFVRVGTLDDPDSLPPDVHIYTESKQPWVRLPEGVPAVAKFYDRRELWPPGSLARGAALRPKFQARDFAIAAHGEQKYGEHPYSFHLDQVAALAAPYGAEATVIAYLHDTAEDTEATIADIERDFGARVAACVALLTDAPGANRKERKAKTYAKLAEVRGDEELALLVKAADRLANVRACIKDDKQSLWRVYRDEHAAFRSAAFRPELCDPLWNELDALLRDEAWA